MKKPFAETKLGQFLGSKGVDTVLDVAGAIIPGVKILDVVKDNILGNSVLSTDDKQIALHLLDQEKEIFDLMVSDRANAREREIEMVKTGSKNFVQNGLAIVSSLLFIFVVVFLLINGIHNITGPEGLLIGTVVGAVITNFKDIHAYYFGSSKGSKDKTETLSQLVSK